LVRASSNTWRIHPRCQEFASMAAPGRKKSMAPWSMALYPLPWRRWPRLHAFFSSFYLATEIIYFHYFCYYFFLQHFLIFKFPCIYSFCIQLFCKLLFYKYLISDFSTHLRGFKKIIYYKTTLPYLRPFLNLTFGMIII
jgi:hypothetical protein